MSQLLNQALRHAEAKAAERGTPLIVAHLDGHVLADDREALIELARALAVDQALEGRSFVRTSESSARPRTRSTPRAHVLTRSRTVRSWEVPRFVR